MFASFFSLVEACMLLLDDTDSAIRSVAVRFVASLDWESKHPKV
jgi:hypothetical protein